MCAKHAHPDPGGWVWGHAPLQDLFYCSEIESGEFGHLLYPSTIKFLGGTLISWGGGIPGYPPSPSLYETLPLDAGIQYTTV